MERLFLKGLPVSDGVGMGEIYILNQECKSVSKIHVQHEQVGEELPKLENSIKKSMKEIYDLKNGLSNRLGDQGEMILEVYKTILGDTYFIDEIKNLMLQNDFSAEYAVDNCFQKYIREIHDSNNEYAKQRIYDLNDIRYRIICNIVGLNSDNLDEICHKQIVVVKELTPYLAAAIGEKNVMGVISNDGAAYFSHSAIILRGLGIPALNNINFDNIKKCESEYAIIDGNNGILIVNPENIEKDRYRSILKRNIKNLKGAFKGKDKPVATRDGHRVGICANIGNIEECNLASERNIDGIGLVRTELLFMNYSKMPDEKEQFEVYLQITKKMNKKPIVFRTADIGDDKMFWNSNKNKYDLFKYQITEPGTRGLINSLVAHREELVIQMRSILRASEFGNLSISFPMVSNADEIREAKFILNGLKEELTLQGKKNLKDIKIGSIIETKDGVKNIDDILDEVDFISIGTNDLLQQTVGIDRDSNDGMIYEYLKPEFLKIIQFCIQRANQKNKSVNVCGEMAADPMAAIVLLGMGVSNLSMTPSKTSVIKDVVRKARFEEAVEVARIAIECEDADKVKSILSVWISNRM